jgi:hypothetical protein
LSDGEEISGFLRLRALVKKKRTKMLLLDASSELTRWWTHRLTAVGGGKISLIIVKIPKW